MLDICFRFAVDIAAMSVSFSLWPPVLISPLGRRGSLRQTSRYEERFLHEAALHRRAAAIASVWSSWPIYSHLSLHFKHRGTPFYTLPTPNVALTRRRLMLQAWPCWAADYRRIDGSEKSGLVTEMGCLPQRAPEPGGMVLLSAPSVKREVPIITQVLLAQLVNSHAHRALGGLLGSRSVWERGQRTLQCVRWNDGCVSTWTGSLGLSAKLSSAFDAAFVSWPQASVNKAP